jgi:uncharacterized protein
VKMYLDTSGLVKLLVPEEGTEQMLDMWNESESTWASRLAYPEARAALAAAVREGRVAGKSSRKAKVLLEEFWGEVDVLEVSAEIAYSAGNAAERFGMSGYDSVHLASALAISDPTLVFVTWDSELARGAHDAGLTVVPPAA